MSAFTDALNGKTTTTTKVSPFQTALTKVAPKTHTYNPIPEPPKEGPVKSFLSNAWAGIKGVAKQVPGAVKDTFQLPTAIVKSEFQPSETQKQIEQLAKNKQGKEDILSIITKPITRAVTPIVEGLGTQVGNILAQNQESNQLVKAPIQVVGKQTQPSQQLAPAGTGPITKDDVLDTILNSGSVVLALAPILGRLANKSALATADLIAKNSRVPISYEDMQKITESHSDTEAVQKVGQIKFNAFREATQADAVRASLKQGYVELAQKAPNKFVNVLKNAATRPVSEIANFTKEYGAKVNTATPFLLDEKALGDQSKSLPVQPVDLKSEAPITPKTAPIEAVKPKVAEIQTEIKSVESKPTIQGQTPSKIAKSIETKAIENKLTQGFEGVAGYDKITIKDQAEKAAKLFSNPEEAMKVIRGEKSLPQGLRGTAAIIAAEEHIAKTGDARMAYELANSPLVSETSAAAQEMRLAAERQPDSITQKLQEIKKAREEAAVKKYGTKAKADTIKEIKAERVKVAPKAKDWAGFLDELKC